MKSIRPQIIVMVREDGKGYAPVRSPLGRDVANLVRVGFWQRILVVRHKWWRLAEMVASDGS